MNDLSKKKLFQEVVICLLQSLSQSPLLRRKLRECTYKLLKAKCKTIDLIAEKLIKMTQMSKIFTRVFQRFSSDTCQRAQQTNWDGNVN